MTAAAFLSVVVLTWTTPAQEETRDLAPATPAISRIAALGRLEPATEVITIAAPQGTDPGRIAEVRVIEGASVRRGQILAVLDSEGRRAAAAARATAEVIRRTRLLERTIVEAGHEEQRLQAEVAAQAASCDRARWDLQKMMRYRDRGLYGDAALVDKRLALQEAERTLAATQWALERQMARGADGMLLDEAVARADLAAASAELAQAHADLEQAYLRSPIDGRIIRLTGRVGERVGDLGFAEVGDTSVMMVRAEVYESDVRYVRAGAAAEITSRAVDGVLRGEVSRLGARVARQTLVTEDPAATTDARVVEVLIRLDARSSIAVAGLTNLQMLVTLPRLIGPSSNPPVGTVSDA